MEKCKKFIKKINYTKFVKMNNTMNLPKFGETIIRRNAGRNINLV